MNQIEHELEGRRKVLLIVEDFDQIRNILGKFFQVNGYVVISVGTLDDALHVGRSENPSLLIVDFEMQKNDPYRILSILHHSLPESNVALMNGARQRCNEEKAHEAGASRILERSLNISALEELIHDAHGELVA